MTLLADPDQPGILACPDCEALHWVVMYGGALPVPKFKCAGCGSCFFAASAITGGGGNG